MMDKGLDREQLSEMSPTTGGIKQHSLRIARKLPFFTLYSFRAAWNILILNPTAVVATSEALNYNKKLYKDVIDLSKDVINLSEDLGKAAKRKLYQQLENDPELLTPLLKKVVHTDIEEERRLSTDKAVSNSLLD
jgi:hypothetical protein